MKPEHPNNLGERDRYYYQALERQGKLPYQIKQRKETERLTKLMDNNSTKAEAPDDLTQLEDFVRRRRIYTGINIAILEATYGKDVIDSDIKALDHCIFGLYCSAKDTPYFPKVQLLVNSLLPTP
ncbi:hypothetical protein HYW46_01510 [Candidatus Daviesbacteria bacterium]|nr:hypothetical protein [Candidatus Daviesbacteria bacterium]